MATSEQFVPHAVDAGIDAISVRLDAVDRTRRLIAAAERRLLLSAARDAAIASRRP